MDIKEINIKLITFDNPKKNDKQYEKFFSKVHYNFTDKLIFSCKLKLLDKNKEKITFEMNKETKVFMESLKQLIIMKTFDNCPEWFNNKKIPFKEIEEKFINNFNDYYLIINQKDIPFVEGIKEYEMDDDLVEVTFNISGLVFLKELFFINMYVEKIIYFVLN
jgi:hypothetical protein